MATSEHGRPGVDHETPGRACRPYFGDHEVSATRSTASDTLTLTNLSFAYQSQYPVIADFSLTVNAGSLFTLLGPSGCGKTTLLRLLGGYLQPPAGRVTLQGRDITSLAPERRDIGMVFQNYALFPHLCAADNIAFGLRMRGVARSERRRRVATMLDRVGLSEAEGKRYPLRLVRRTTATGCAGTGAGDRAEIAVAR